MTKNGFKHPTWPARTVFPGRRLEKNGFEKWHLTWENTFRSHFFNQKCAKPLAILHLQNSVYFYPFSIKKNGFERKNSRSEPIFRRHFFQAIYLRKGYAQLRGHIFGRFLPFRSHFFRFRSHFFILQMALKMASWLFCPCKSSNTTYFYAIWTLFHITNKWLQNRDFEMNVLNVSSVYKYCGKSSLRSQENSPRSRYIQKMACCNQFWATLLILSE